MPFRFRKSVRLFPGVRLNLSKSGMSVSVGGPGATVNLSRRGHSVTLGLPGTGLSYRQQLTSPRQNRVASTPEAVPRSLPPQPTGSPVPENAPIGIDAMIAGEIRSADVAELTTPDLEGLKRLLNEAAAQKASLQPDIAAALESRFRAWRRLRRREQLPLRLFFAKRIPQARTAFEEAEAEAFKVLEAIAASEVRVVFAFDGAAMTAQGELALAHAELSRAQVVWDVLSSVGIDRAQARSAASVAITRTPVMLSTVTDGIIAGDQPGLRFQNANGADLDFFPGFLLMRQRGADDYALIDLRDIQLDVQRVRFIEDEAVPADAQIMDYAWAKSNRDGSPDRRFKDNRQIPVVQYGGLHFSTRAGLAEAYHVSDCDKALAFGAAFHRLQTALTAMAAKPLREDPRPLAEAPLFDPATHLPTLPAVRGAHEFTAGAAAALVALAIFVGRIDRPIRVPPVVEASPAATMPTSLTSVPGASVAPMPPRPAPTAVPGSTTDPNSTAVPVVPGSSAPARERLLTKNEANVRAGPNRNTPSVRVLPIHTTVEVFGREGQWVKVGQGQAWGWMHASVLSPR